MADDEETEKAVGDFTKHYLQLVEKKMEHYWPYFEKVLYGTGIFRGTKEKFSRKELIKPCFYLWVLICDISGAHHMLYNQPFMSLFDNEVSKLLGVDFNLYSAWRNVAMSFYDSIGMSRKGSHRIYGLYCGIYQSFDHNYKHEFADKNMILDAVDNMANEMYTTSVLVQLFKDHYAV